MADNVLTDKQIQDLEDKLAKEDQAHREKQEATRAQIRAAHEANASKVFNDLHAQLQNFGPYFSLAQKNKISGFFTREPKVPKSPKDPDDTSSSPDKFYIPDGPNKGQTWNGRGKVVKGIFAEWYKTEEGKAWVKTYLATEEGKAWKAANSVDGKIKTDEKGQAKGPFPINPAYIEWQKANPKSGTK